ncbi:MAG: efflux transporter outer membrane subunit [Pseudomonadota bacterium]
MLRAVVLAGGITALIAGCAPGPDYVRPDLGLPDAYLTQTDADLGQAERLWWRGFQDPTLSQLIEEAFSANLSLAAAQARFDAAREGITSAKSDFFPTVDGSVTGQIRGEFDGPDGKNAQAGFGGALPLDTNGRLRRSLEQARALSERSGFDVLDARRLIAAGVAANYVELQRSRARLALLDFSLNLQNQTLDIVKARRRAGLAAALDVERAASDLARTRAQRGLLEVGEARAHFALALLLGKAPQEALVPFGDPKETPQVPQYKMAAQSGVPADLLRKRPDVLAAEADLMAASAAIGIQQADLLPSLRIPGSLTANRGDNGFAFFSGAAALISATIDVPLIDAGRRRAEVRAARANARAAVASYELAVLSSIQDVELALVSVDALQARQDDLAAAVAASEAAFEQLNALYKEGLATFIDILDAQRSLIASREAFVDVEAALATAYVDLYAATGAPTQLVEAAAR